MASYTPQGPPSAAAVDAGCRRRCRLTSRRINQACDRADQGLRRRLQDHWGARPLPECAVHAANMNDEGDAPIDKLPAHRRAVVPVTAVSRWNNAHVQRKRRRSFLGSLDPYHGGLQGARTPFLPLSRRPSPFGMGRFYHDNPLNDFRGYASRAIVGRGLSPARSAALLAAPANLRPEHVQKKTMRQVRGIMDSSKLVRRPESQFPQRQQSRR